MSEPALVSNQQPQSPRKDNKSIIQVTRMEIVNTIFTQHPASDRLSHLFEYNSSSHQFFHQ